MNPMVDFEIELHKQGGESLADSKLAVMEVYNNHGTARMAHIKRSVLVQNRDDHLNVNQV